MHLHNHVRTLQDAITPQIFKKSSYKLVKTAARHLEVLSPGHAAMQEIRQALNSYKSSHH